MPTVRRRSSNLISQSTLDQAQSALQQLPEKPKENLSLKEAIASLQTTITTALSRGYSYEEVAAMLSEQGVKISPTSLKSYLAAVQKDSTSKSTSTRGRKRRSSSATVETPAATNTEPTVEAVETPEAEPKRRGRKPKAVSPEPEVTVADAPATTEESPTPKRGRRPKSAEPVKTAAKRTTRTSTASAETGKPTSSTRGRRKKAG